MIKIFFYVYQVKKWNNIYDELISQLIRSGIKYDQLYILSSHTKIDEKRLKCTSVSNNGKNEYEFFALKFLHTHVQPTDKILYMHTKGVNKNTPQTHAWRKYMAHFCIDKYSTCLESLKTYDTCGVDLTINKDSMRHVTKNKKLQYSKLKFFAGNFWWANGSYLHSLPRLDELNQKYRWGAERWIGMHPNPKMKSIYQSKKDLYKDAIPIQAYIK
jgi:hypothetical protein